MWKNLQNNNYQKANKNNYKKFKPDVKEQKDYFKKCTKELHSSGKEELPEVCTGKHIHYILTWFHINHTIIEILTAT